MSLFDSEYGVNSYAPLRNDFAEEKNTKPPLLVFVIATIRTTQVPALPTFLFRFKTCRWEHPVSTL